ncbi:hypothetical protein DXG03_005542 [Asterophora parasitica]|uniref:Polysaccharide lyase 14 domain-containing protein n=1 Tax=Asterophora parasitica TaxID=117018 RepID=A0A9P7K9P0_9AGAR|nr:hypothetical protein DXG03_005542 [Asterophora parasitica]
MKHGFTTSAHLKSTLPSSVAAHLTHVSLTDSALGVHKSSSRTPHHLVTPPHSSHKASDGQPDPEKAWEARYPKGSINPSGTIPGGFGFYLTGPSDFKEALEKGSGAKEVVFGYRMMLEPGWEWVKGGKLPGVYGGVGDQAYGCTGGRQDQRCTCFDLRPMWRAKGTGELYAYLPLTKTNSTHLLAAPPTSIVNADYGISVGRGSFHLDIAVGRWVSIAFRVRMNDVGAHNGVYMHVYQAVVLVGSAYICGFGTGTIQVWVDGVSAINVSGIAVCQAKDARIKGMHFQTFFGGHTAEWASPKEQRAWFADVSGAIVE